MLSNSSTARALNATGLKKTALATSISLLFGGMAAPSAIAALPTGATLDFNLGTAQTVSCNYGTTPPCNKASYATTDIVGSYFVMDTNGNGPEPNEKTPIGSFNGLVIGTTQSASGSHTGGINGSEVPNLDNPWTFFGGTGMHQTTSNVDVVADAGNVQTLDFSGWNVTWNGIASIPLTEQGTTTITCDDASCGAGAGYTIDGAFHVTGAGFTSVSYFLHMEGNVSLPGAVPVAIDDSATTIVGNPRTIDVTVNDQSADPLIAGSVAIDTDGANGTAIDNADDTVTYTPDTGPDFSGQDTFVYTVDNANGTSLASPAGNPGEQGIVTVDVQVNAAPVATDDPIVTNPVALDQGGGQLPINVLANDSDPNNIAGLPGGIDVTTVAASVTNAPGNIGTCVGNADGTITYTQSTPSVATTDTCTYTVTDSDVFQAPLTSNTATVTVDVQAINSDWPTVLPPGVIPILAFDPGTGGTDQSIEPDGSWFSMQVSASQLIYTNLVAGPDGGIIVDADQPATGSHTGSPNGTEQPGVTAPWVFFSNTGFDFTRNGGISNNGDGTLLYRDKFVITWNGIEVINLGGSSQFPEDLGFATIICSDKPCQDGSTFVLDYAAHVEDLPGFTPSGFNGVAYAHHMEGTVHFLDGNVTASDGTVTNQTRLSSSDTTDDPDVDLQCAGGCFDYTIDGVTPGSRVSIVLPLQGGVPNNPVWRILDNGVWRDFDTSTGDSVKTAPFIAGGVGMECPPAGDAAYIDLVNQDSPNVGHQCVQLSITDDGLNDLNKTPGTIEDPSGLGTAGTPTFVDNRTSSNSGCSLAAGPGEPGRHGEWWLLGGLLGWLALRRRKA